MNDINVSDEYLRGIAAVYEAVIYDDFVELSRRGDFRIGLRPRSVEVRWMDDDEVIHETWVHLGVAEEVIAARYTSLADNYRRKERAVGAA